MCICSNLINSLKLRDSGIFDSTLAVMIMTRLEVINRNAATFEYEGMEDVLVHAHCSR
jgi:hypothetical protein